MSIDDAPDFKRVDVCFYCEFLRPWNSMWDIDYCEKHDFEFKEKQVHAYVCKSFKHWKKEMGKENDNFKIETFEGIRYKIFLVDKVNDEGNGISKIHIERNFNSGLFEKMTIDEIKKYVGDVGRDIFRNISGYIKLKG